VVVLGKISKKKPKKKTTDTLIKGIKGLK